MNGDQIGGIIRAVGAAAGGYFVSKGLADEATVSTITGALVTLAVAVWSIYTNQSSRLAATPAAK